MSDPTRHSAESSDLGEGTLEDYIASYQAPSWPVRQYYAWRRLPSNVRRWMREFREFFVRGRHGWAPSDTWGLDHYLAGVIGHSLKYLANNNHGWPGDGSRWASPEEWEAELHKQADLLIAYAKDDDLELSAGPAIRRLSEYWGHLWD